MFADEIRRAIEAASRIALPQVTAQLWRAFGDGHITEAEAERLSALIEARTLTGKVARFGQPLSPTEPQPVEGRYPSGPHRKLQAVCGLTPAHGCLDGASPPLGGLRAAAAGLAARFTLAEQAVLALVAAETTRRGDCRLAVGHLAAIVGVAETTVRNAIREAAKLGLVTVEERRITGFRNDTNIVRIVAPEWTAWLRLARKTHPAHLPQQAAEAEGGGCKSPKRTHTQVLNPLDSKITQPSKGCRRAAGDLDRATPSRIQQGGGKARAMR